MAITFVAAGTGAGGTGTATPGMPAGATTGDILILVIEGEGEDVNADSPPTGGAWNTIGSIASATDGAVDRTRCSVYWAWYDSGINRVVPDAGNHTIARIYAFRGVDTTDPIDATSTSGSALNATSHTAATGLSSVTNGAMAVLAYAHGDGTGTVPASWANANLVSANDGGYYEDNSGSDGTVGIIYGIKTTAGAIGSFTWSTTASEERAWWAIALRPLSESKNVTPGVGALVLAGFAATVFATNPINATPGVGALALTGYEPTVVATNHITVNPDVGSLTINGLAPDVSATVNQVVTPGLGELLLAGYAPTVTATDHKNIVADVGSLVLTGLEPTVEAANPIEVTPDVGALTLAGLAPTVFASDLINIQADVGSLVLTGLEPTVFVGNAINIDAGLGELTLAGLEPVIAVSDNKNIQIGLGELLLAGLEPTVAITNHINIQTDVGQLTLTGIGPTVLATANQNIIAGLGELVLTGFEPSVVTSTDDWRNPSSLTEDVGAIVSGTLADVYIDSDATELVLSETVGTPGFDYTFEFGIGADVPSTLLHLYVEGYYDGNVAHNVKLQQWNYDTSAWTDVSGAVFPDAVAEQNYKFRLINDPDYISSGNIKLRVVHTSAGNPVHQFHLDKFYVDLTDDKEAEPSVGQLVLTGYAPVVYKQVPAYRWDGASWIPIGYFNITSVGE